MWKKLGDSFHKNYKLLEEHHEDRLWHLDGIACRREQTCGGVYRVDLHLITVATGTEQETAVGRDGEIAWMDARELVSDLGDEA